MEDEHEKGRREQIARNEAVYRTVNEKIEDITQTLSGDLRTMAILCECGDIECTEQVEVDLSKYEQVRADPTLFLVIPGHEIDDVEQVIEQRHSFMVVCKNKGAGAAVARETDPRA